MSQTRHFCVHCDTFLRWDDKVEGLVCNCNCSPHDVVPEENSYEYWKEVTQKWEMLNKTTG